MATVGQYDDAVRNSGQFFQFGRDDHERHALGTEFFDHFEDFRMGADIDAAGRLIEDQKPGMGGKPACQNGLLLVATGQEFYRPVGIGRADVERFDEAFGKLRLLPARKRPRPALTGLKRQCDIVGHGKVADDTIRLALLRAKTEPGSDRGFGRGNGNRFPVYRGLAGIGLVDAKQQESRFRSAGTQETGDADDFAGANTKIEGAMLPRLP